MSLCLAGALPPCLKDLRNALSPADTCEALGLPQMKGRKWHVQVGAGPCLPPLWVLALERAGVA